MNIHRIYIYAPVAGVPPVDLEQALVQGEQLRQSGGGQEVPESLLTMAGQLEDYVRGLSEGSEEELEEDILVNDLNDLLLGMKDWLVSKGVPIITFEMPVEGWRHLLWQIVELARPVGLVVVDSELMMVFLPSGMVYPESRLPDWIQLISSFVAQDKRPSEENLPKTVKQFINWSRPTYEKYLQGKGFIKRGRSESGSTYYSRDFGPISARVYFNYQVNYPFFYGLNSMSINSKVVCEILRRFKVRTLDDIVFYLPMYDQIDEEVVRGMPPISASSVEWEIDLFNKYVMEVLDDITNIQQLDEFLFYLPKVSERARLSFEDFIPHRLIIAKIAERRDFDVFASNLRASIPLLHQKSLDLFDEIVAYLRTGPTIIN